METRRLSKSQYCKGRKCLKRVWLYNFRKELMEPPSAFQETIFEQGHEVGRLAHRMFPGGVLVEQDLTDPEGALAQTSKLMAAGVPAIFEAAFLHDNILIRADIVAQNTDGTWDLFEVKSTTSVKKEHLQDAAVQRYVLLGTSFPLRSVHLVHLNREYVKRGPIEVDQLFQRELLDKRIEEAYDEIPRYIASIREALKRSHEPTVRIGSVCKNPYPCEFKSYCWSGIKSDAIHYLSRITDSKRFELMDRSIEKIKDIPDDVTISDLQSVQVRVERSGKPNIELKSIKKHLAVLQYPLWYLDFETYGFAIPEYDGTRTYDQLTFQFSLEIQDAQGSDLRHIEFLYLEKSDPRRALAEALVGNIGKAGSVITYHASFERSRIEELAEAFPDLKSQLDSIAERLWDLETPFAKKWFYDQRFAGSSSIKKVLPVLVPSMTYEGMSIGKGDVAQMKYMEMISLSMDSPERERIRRDLLEYCGQDTMAMVKILEALAGLK